MYFLCFLFLCLHQGIVLFSFALPSVLLKPSASKDQFLFARLFYPICPATVPIQQGMSMVTCMDALACQTAINISKCLFSMCIFLTSCTDLKKKKSFCLALVHRPHFQQCCSIGKQNLSFIITKFSISPQGYCMYLYTIQNLISPYHLPPTHTHTTHNISRYSQVEKHHLC